MCDKTVNTDCSTTQFVPKYCKTQEMCDRAVNICFFIFDSVPDQYKFQEMYEGVVSKGPFTIVYCSHRFKN